MKVLDCAEQKQQRAPWLDHSYKGKLATSSALQGRSQPWVPHGDSTYPHLSEQWFPVMCGNRGYPTLAA